LHAINCGFGRVRGIMPQPGEAGKRILEGSGAHNWFS